MNNTKLIDRKRAEIVDPKSASSRKRKSSGDSNKDDKKRQKEDIGQSKKLGPFKCVLCLEYLKPNDHHAAVDHFATHFWLLLSMASKNRKKLPTAKGFMETTCPLDFWFSHHGLTNGNAQIKTIRDNLNMRLDDIAQYKWCVLCLKDDISSNGHLCDFGLDFTVEKFQAVFSKFETIQDIDKARELFSPSRAMRHVKKIEKCHWCEEGYQSHDYIRHVALDHFRNVFLRDSDKFDRDRGSVFKCGKCYFKETGGNLDNFILHRVKKHDELKTFLDSLGLSRDATRAKYVFNDFIVEHKNGTAYEQRSYSCKECRRGFRTKALVVKHVLLTHPRGRWALPDQAPFACPACNVVYENFLKLCIHIGVSHNLDDQEEDSEPSVSRQRPEDSSDRQHQQHQTLRTNYAKKPRLDPRLSKSPWPKPPKPSLKDFLTKEFAMIESGPVKPTEHPDVNDKTDAKDDSSNEEQLVANVHPPSRLAILQNTVKEYNGVPHKWLCNGRLLLLQDPTHPGNMRLFQDQWIRGQPVVVSNSSDLLNQHLWHPQAFLNDFGHIRHDLVNCLTGKTVPKARLADFWKGFMRIKNRLLDETGTPMLLKLKDWPPSDDIANYMPKRWDDFIKAFPLKEYTWREGSLNLASYLPDYCLKPELGPKMYIAYGSALYSAKGSTNLHIDMSDAVNCMVYVGFPEDGNVAENAKEVFKEIDKAGCDNVMRERARNTNTLPGALWHIFHPSDTGKIRDLLNKVAMEKGKRLDPHDDPIHDQSTYLDAPLLERLYRDYGVKGYAIVQCAGDTVFIPAGAAHQVRNLHNCIKVAEDFVSPENISHCLHLTQEFRHLTEWHTNHEDKLQIKTILFHSIKTAIGVIDRELAKAEKAEKDKNNKDLKRKSESKR